jgi:hypothetical protein
MEPKAGPGDVAAISARRRFLFFPCHASYRNVPVYGSLDLVAVDQGSVVEVSPSHRAVRRAQPSCGCLPAGPAWPRAGAAATSRACRAPHPGSFPSSSELPSSTFNLHQSSSGCQTVYTVDHLARDAPPRTTTGALSNASNPQNGTLGEQGPFPHPFPAKHGLPLTGFRPSSSMSAVWTTLRGLRSF